MRGGDAPAGRGAARRCGGPVRRGAPLGELEVLRAGLYEAPVGPIQVIDVIYGWSPEIEKSGNDFFAHKTGFSQKSLCGQLLAAGFAEVWNAPAFAPYELRALAFKGASTSDQRRLLRIPLDAPGAAGG